MSRKHKFDLTHLVHEGLLKDGETLHFVSDPAKACTVAKQPNGDFKVLWKGKPTTVHACAQEWLGQEPPQHASKWLRNAQGKTLYDLWHAGDVPEAA